MKAKVLFCLAAVILIAGCKKDTGEIAAGAPEELSYTVSSGMKGAGFSRGDRISLLNGQYKGYLTAEASGESAVFSGKAPKLSSQESYFAVYPYSEDYELDGNSVTMTVPSEVIPENGIITGVFGTGVPKGKELHLNPVTDIIRFTVTRDDIESLVLRSGGKKMAGTIKVSKTGVMDIQEGTEAVLISEKITPGTYCVQVFPQGYNGFTVDVTTAAGSARFSTDKYASNDEPGLTIDLGTIDEDLDIQGGSAEGPALELIGTSATSAAVTWSISGFNDVYADISQLWSAGIFGDPACTDLRVSWDFPAALWNVYGGSTITTYEGPFSPRFIFTSLEPETDYYVKVWYTGNPSKASAVLKVHTGPAAFKTMPESPASEGEVILQEDFSELPWGGDVATRSFGYSDEKRSSAPAFDAAFGENPQGAQTIGGFEHKCYLVSPVVEIGLFNTLRSAVASSRLKDWTSIAEDNSDGKVLCRPGYIKLGSGNMTGGIVTPALSCLSERALVRLSFKAHPFRESVNDPLTASAMVINSAESGVSVLKDYTVSQKENFTIGENHEWKEFSYEFLVQPGERLAVSTRREGAAGSQRRMLIDDIKVELVEYRPQTKIMQIRNAQDLIAFLEAADTYEAEEIVTVENDIDLTDVTLTAAPLFAGTLDGKGHSLRNWKSLGESLMQKISGTIKDLTIDSSCELRFAETPAGPFGFVAQEVLSGGVLDGIVNNASITQTVSITGSESAVLSPIAGRSYGLVQNCTNNGSVAVTATAASQNVYMGGIVGYINSGDRLGLKANVNNGNLTYRVEALGKYIYLGGISAGTSTTTIANATASKGTMEDCVNTGNISYISTNGGSLAENEGAAGSGNYIKVGGVVGYFEGNVTGCTNGVAGDPSKGQVSVTIPTKEDGACATGTSIGGVAAFVLRNTSGCHNYGKVSISGTFAGGGTGNQGCGVTGEFAAGGIVGQTGPSAEASSYSLSDCHNHGTVDFKGWMAYTNETAFNFGGVAGYSAVPVSDCSNDGTVRVESKGAYVRAGGVIGFAARTAAGITNSGKFDCLLIRSSTSKDNPENYKQLATQLIVGGAIGRAGGAASDCVNSGAVTLTTNAKDNLAAKLQMGGAVGYAVSTFSGSNSGKVTVVSHDGKQVVLGGVIGEGAAQGLSTACSNTGNISAALGTVGQSWVGGVFGSIAKPGSGNVTHNGVENHGSITLSIENSSNTGFYYLGGVSGTSAASHVFTNCKNYGDITYTGHAKMRIGGINAYMNQTATGSVVECDITANCTGRDYSEVGGVSAYTAATNLLNWSFKGSINTSGSTSKVYTGGLLGKSNGNAAFNGCSFDGTLTGAAGGNVPGLYVGGLQANGLTHTFGSTAKCVVAAGSKVNGAAVASLTTDNLVSQSSDGGTFASTGTLTNIVIE